MFSIGAGELFLILIIAVIFLKPSDIPKYARLIGIWYKRLKDIYEEIEKTKTKVIQAIDNNIKESIIDKNSSNDNKDNVSDYNSYDNEKKLENKNDNYNIKENINNDIKNTDDIKNSNEERHLFYMADFFPKNMKILIIGSFPISLYTQESLYYSLNEEERLNAWYYSSKKNEFWKIIADVFEVENKEIFLKNKEEKINLFEKNSIGITDIILSCKRKNALSSEDKNLIIKKYNTNIIPILEKSNDLKNIIFTSKFSEKCFYKMLKNENFNFEIKNIKTPKIKTLNKTILNSLKIKNIIIENKKVVGSEENNNKNEIASVAISLKRSSVKGVSLYSTKKTLFKYFLNRK